MFIDEIRKHKITEQDMRNEFNKGSIEMSFTGEWVPLEVVEGEFKDFIQKLKEVFQKSESVCSVIDKLAGEDLVKP